MQCNDTGKVQRAQPPIANPQNAGLNAAGDLGDLMTEPYLQLHLEPSEHIEVSELTGALTALARQYQTFAVQNQIAKKPSDARFLVSSVALGSTDISLYPDLVAT